jgi:hypothetical protein
MWDYLKPQLDLLGVKMVCVILEDKENEVNTFYPAYWPGEVYCDTKKELFKVLGGGKLRKASLLKLLNPFHQYWKNLADAKKKIKEQNFNGHKLILGGVMVIDKKDNGGHVLHMQVEKDIGQPPSIPKVLEAARLAVSQKC